MCHIVPSQEARSLPSASRNQACKGNQSSRENFHKSLCHQEKKSKNSINTRCGRNNKRRLKGGMVSQRPVATRPHNSRICESHSDIDWEAILWLPLTADISESTFVHGACPECLLCRCVYCLDFATAS